jgi:hypothetical protein
MCVLEGTILDTLIKWEIMILIIDGWFAIHSILSGSIDATLMWSLLPL